MHSQDFRTEALLRGPETPLADDGFSERVMGALPRRHLKVGHASRWTLGLGATTGGLLTAALASPLEDAFARFAGSGGMLAPVIAVLFIAVVAAPIAWTFYSR